MKKRLFPALLALAMVLTMLPLAVFAAPDVGADEGTDTNADGNASYELTITPTNGTAVTKFYNTTKGLNAAIAGLTAESSVEIKVLKEVTVTGGGSSEAPPIWFSGEKLKTATLDLNGKTVTSSGSGTWTVVALASDITIKDTGTVKGKLVNNADSTGGCVIYAGGDGTKVTVEDDVVIESTNGTGISITGNKTPNGGAKTVTVNVKKATISSAKSVGILVAGNGATLVVDGANVSSKGNAAIAGNGTKTETQDHGNTSITINSGTFTGTDNSNCALYHPQAGNLIINGGTFSGKAGVIIRAGTVDINGGEFIATSESNVTMGDRNVAVPAAGILFDEEAGYPVSEGADIKIEPEEGKTLTVTSAGNQPAVKVLTKTGSTGQKLEVGGGTFNKPVDPEYLADDLDYQAVNGDGDYSYHATQEAAETAAGDKGSVAQITDEGKVEPIIKIKATGFIWDVDDKAKIAEATAAGVTTTADWVDQTIWVAFDQALPADTHYWFDVEINGKTYGIAANGDGKHAAQAFSFLNLGQWENPPEELVDDDGNLLATVKSAKITVYKTAKQLDAAPSAEDKAKFDTVGEAQNLTIPAKPTNANPNLKITSVKTDAPLYAKVTVSGMDKSKVYAIRLANSTAKDASMVILIVDNVETYDIYCKDKQKIWVFEYASKDVIVEGDSQHTSLEYGEASKIA